MFGSISTEASYPVGGFSGNGVNRAGQQPAQITSRPATQLDLEEYYGGPVAGTMRAIMIFLDGKQAGIIGVVREREYGKYFTDHRPELQPHLRSITIMRAVKEGLRFADEYRGPVIAIAEHAESCRLLNRLGFTHLEGALYGWLN